VDYIQFSYPSATGFTYGYYGHCAWLDYTMFGSCVYPRVRLVFTADSVTCYVLI